ncbi:PGG domain-containing protein [Artemisia annua]|uniref:PGG domain-containing protein n=1 Tax=Artemisia annua TaxID=35608 RepID=A0A2U1MQ58_ARTAN|nr:PGG domain-containing protein [Artemisia annua]
MRVFIREHKELKKKGEEWLKKTAESCTITAALIVTITFAAAITVPGGLCDNIEEHGLCNGDGIQGLPILRGKDAFTVFAVSNAASLCTSTVSLLFFLSILTSRYAEKNFLRILPRKLMCGLVMLFFSVATMLVAFGATLYLMYAKEKTSTKILIAIATGVPILVFVVLRLDLLLRILFSTHSMFLRLKLQWFWTTLSLDVFSVDTWKKLLTPSSDEIFCCCV